MPVDFCNDPEIAFITGGQHQQEKETILARREEFFSAISDAITKQLLDYITTKDTHNGYKT